MSTVTRAYVCKAGDAEVRWWGDTPANFLATGAQTGEAFALVDERADRGVTVPFHRHDADMESFYVLEGEVTFFVEDEPGVTVGACSFVHLPGGTVHGFRIASDSARYLILTTPRHGEFYRSISLPSRAGGLKPLEPADELPIGQAIEDYGIQFIGALPEA